MDDFAIQIIEYGRFEGILESLSLQSLMMSMIPARLADKAEMATNHEL